MYIHVLYFVVLFWSVMFSYVIWHLHHFNACRHVWMYDILYTHTYICIHNIHIHAMFSIVLYCVVFYGKVWYVLKHIQAPPRCTGIKDLPDLVLPLEYMSKIIYLQHFRLYRKTTAGIYSVFAGSRTNMVQTAVPSSLFSPPVSKSNQPKIRYVQYFCKARCKEKDVFLIPTLLHFFLLVTLPWKNVFLWGRLSRPAVNYRVFATCCAFYLQKPWATPPKARKDTPFSPTCAGAFDCKGSQDLCGCCMLASEWVLEGKEYRLHQHWKSALPDEELRAFYEKIQEWGLFLRNEISPISLVAKLRDG